MEELQKYKQVFDQFDKSGDNKISKDELKAALQQMGYNVSDTMMEAAMEELDKDGSGFLNFPEFMEFCQMQPPPDGGDALRKAFTHFDSDGSGFIGIEELRQILEKSGRKVPDKVLRKLVDKLGGDDGRISFEEFVQMMHPQ